MKTSLHSICSFLSLVTRLATPTFDHAHSPKPPPEMAIAIVLFLWLNGWSRHIWCAILLKDNMDLHRSSLGTLIPEGPWRVFYAKRSQVYWGLTHNVVFYWYSDLISQTYKHTRHTQGQADWHTHINVYLHHLLCAQSSYLYYTT